MRGLSAAAQPTPFTALAGEKPSLMMLRDVAPVLEGVALCELCLCNCVVPAAERRDESLTSRVVTLCRLGLPRAR